MALVAVSIVGAENLPAEVFRRAGAALAARIEITGLGPVEREAGIAAMAVVLRTRIGPSALEKMLRRLTPTSGSVSFGVLAYGALVYRDEEIVVPPANFANLGAILRSLARVDPDFQIPNLGNVSAHLSDSLDRPPN